MQKVVFIVDANLIEVKTLAGDIFVAIFLTWSTSFSYFKDIFSKSYKNLLHMCMSWERERAFGRSFSYPNLGHKEAFHALQIVRNLVYSSKNNMFLCCVCVYCGM